MLASLSGMKSESRTESFSRTLRIHALRMTNRGGGSHVGSCLSIADIIGVLYGEILNVFPENPRHPDRDRLILSKGHAGAVVYAALAERGFFPVEQLATHYANGSFLCGHVSHDGVPGVEVSTGSLGQGLSIGAGMALAADVGAEHAVFVVLSDGECNSGATWEAALFAAHQRLGRLVAVIDYNKLQSLDSVENTLGLEPLSAKWSSFGWHVVEVDGHNHGALTGALQAAKDGARGSVPTAIIAHTVKGKGVSFMENSVLWHYRVARGEEFTEALRELTAFSKAEENH